MIISVRIVERDGLVIKWDDRSDELTEMSVKLETRGREWIIAIKDVMH